MLGDVSVIRLAQCLADWPAPTLVVMDGDLGSWQNGRNSSEKFICL